MSVQAGTDAGAKAGAEAVPGHPVTHQHTPPLQLARHLAVLASRGAPQPGSGSAATAAACRAQETFVPQRSPLVVNKKIKLELRAGRLFNTRQWLSEQSGAGRGAGTERERDVLTCSGVEFENREQSPWEGGWGQQPFCREKSAPEP